MARKTKASSRRSTKKKPSGAKAAARPKKAAKAPAKRAAKRKGAKKGGSARGTEVERNWANYLAQRTLLETAVTAVQAAEEELAKAREVEATRRKEFDDSKQSLEQMLEVEPATPRSGNRRNKPIDFPGPLRSPSSKDDHEVTLG